MGFTTVLYLLYVRLSIWMDFRQLFIFSRLNKLTCVLFGFCFYYPFKRVPPIWVHMSSLRTMLKKTSFLDCPLLRFITVTSYLRLDKHREQFVSRSNPNKHPVSTSGLWIRTFDPAFTPIGFSVKKQHQLLCWKFSTATPVHCKLQKRSESKFRVLSQVSFHKVVGNVADTMETEKCRSFVV